MVRDTASATVTRRRLLESGALLSAGGILATQTQARVREGREPQQDGASQASLLCGTTLTGELTPDDETGFRGQGFYQDEYQFDAEGGQTVSLAMEVTRRDATGDEGTAMETETATDSETTPAQSDGGEQTEGQPDTGTQTEGQSPAESGDPYLYLLGPDGAIVAEDDDSAGGLDAFLSVQSLPATGTYTVIATSFAAADTFQYALTLTCGDPLDPVSIQCDETVTGELVPDDEIGFLGPGHVQDSYTFQAEAGAVVDVSMSALEAPVNGVEATQAVADPYLLVLGPDGSLVAFDDDSAGDLNASLTATLVAGGQYTIVATSFAPEQYFPYQLSLDCRAPLEPASIECGETVTGELTPDDESGVRTVFGVHYHDAYAFEGAAGDQVTISMDASRAGGRFGDPYLFLFAPDGTVLAEDDDCGGDLNALLRRRLPTDGQYTVVATSFGAEEFFTYDLSLVCGNQPVPLPDPTSLTCGETVVGELAPDDAAGFRGPEHFHDIYEFEGSAGDLVTLSLSSSAGDPYLYLLDPDDSIVAENDDGGGNLDSLIRNYELQQSGTYMVVATSFDERAFFEYNLSLQCLSETTAA